MNSLRLIKTLVVGGFFILALLLTASNTPSKVTVPAGEPAAAANQKPEDYVGSETCKGCHEDYFNSFAKTTHARLSQAGWKPEKQGCESCHGPGKLHVDGGGDKSKIRTFEDETPKQKSDTCLQCHAGREEHNNFRRGEHWRNDVSCIDCHAPHISKHPVVEPKSNGSSSLLSVGPFASHASDFVPNHLLRKPEVQLCMKCHNETKSQFTRPFHHKVLEGAMNCSDCHNPHGGFEMKQARSTSGADAACFKCHTDKQGPFVFEHAPLKVEGCAACHDPHGSANPKLLKRSTVAQLCIECHSNTGTVPGEDFGGASQVPHDVSSPRYRNCTICHAKIHGSNASTRFFR